MIQYQKKLKYCVYHSHIKTNIYEVIITSKDKESPIVSGRNEYVVAASLISLNDRSYEELKIYDKDINIGFESVVPKKILLSSQDWIG